MSGHDVFEAGNIGNSIKMDLGSMTSTEQLEYRNGVFSLLVYIPIMCAIVQLLAWSRFTLKGRRLEWVKAVREGSVYATV